MESASGQGQSQDATGLGLRVFVGYVYPMDQVSWFGQVGLAGSPSGGNNDVNVTYGPLWTLSVGAEFGR
jgi:hypothetical protein